MVNGKFEYFFNQTDYQGNIRAATDAKGAAIEHNDYYPFGMLFGTSVGKDSKQPFKFGGKEYISAKGFNTYDFGARGMDGSNPRWPSMDKFAEMYYSISPYAYCANNPTKYIDPNGKWIETVWDIANVVMGANSFVNNVSNGNVVDAVVDGVGIAIDVVAAALPLVPAGAGTAIKATRSVDKATDASKTIKNVDNTTNLNKFDGGSSTNSKTSNEALRKAKDQNGIPRSQQPNKTIKPNTPEGKNNKLDSRNIKQYEYTNSKGEKVSIRQDKPAQYPDGGKQPAHYNAGKDKKLEQHHNYGN